MHVEVRNDLDLVGLIPAGGRANRIQPIPCSKEIYPVGFLKESASGAFKAKTVSDYLLEQMHLAGVLKTYIVLRKGKWDIPSYLGNGQSVGMDLAYLVMGKSHGVPFTLDQAYPFVKKATIVFGFPDILVWPTEVYTVLLEKLKTSDVDIVLGLFPADDSRKVDMVEVDAWGRPLNILIKPKSCSSRYAWINAVWTPRFTRFMHDCVSGWQDHISVPPGASNIDGGIAERHLGNVIQAAIKDGISLSSVTFETGRFIDIGTPDDLFRGVVSLIPPAD